MKPTRVLLFDVFGTLVDWRSSLIDLAEATAVRAGVQADWADVVDDWRRAYQPAMDRVRRGAPWRDLDSLQRESLADVLALRGIRLSEADREVLVRGWRQLHPWPDSRAGLDRLRRKYVTATLSNGHLALLADLLKFADLRVDAVLSRSLPAATSPTPACTSPRCACSIASLTMPRWWPRTRQTCRRPLRWAFVRSTSSGRWSGDPACRPPFRPHWTDCSKPTDSSSSLKTWAADARARVVD